MSRELAAWWREVSCAPGRAAALWRLPGAARQVQGLASAPGPALRPLPAPAGPPPLAGEAPGFVFFPFQESAPAPAWFIPADTTARFELPAALPPAAGACPPEHDLPPLPYAADAAAYQQLVREAIAYMRTGQAQKVVGSRAAVRPLPPDFDVLTAFGRLCAAYPQAFVSLVKVPGAGYWLGATPELLAEVTPTAFRTISLAGTQPLTATTDAHNARWGSKETEEQALVSRFIQQAFARSGLSVRQTGPRTVAAGSLLHLRTDFEASLPPDSASQAAALVAELHPTPAVGGTPQATARAFLAAHEGYDRRYYSGFLGPVNLPAAGTTHLFVNLRCAELRPAAGLAVLYAGAGLTVDSIPAQEWQETELKLDVVGRGLVVSSEVVRW